MILSTDSSDEDDVVAYYYFRRRKQDKRFWVYPYLDKKNIHCRLFLAAKELQQTDFKFIAFNRMSKHCCMDLVQMISPAILQQNTNMTECVSAEKRILITLR